MECTNCAACIAGCDYHALGYRFVLPLGIAKGDQADGEPDSSNQLSQNGESETDHRSFAQEEPAPGDSRPVRCSAGSAGRLSILALAMVLLAPSPAMAHHILGLPHYSYKENYPQAPTLEYPATTGPYDVLMTSYPGKPVPGEAATIAFYIKDRTSGQPLEQAVTVQVLKTSTFGGNEVIYPPATHTPFDNQHKYTITFPEDHEYIVELSLDVEGQTEVIPFLIVAGQPTATRSILIVIGCGLVFFLLVVRAIKVKRDRRQRVAATGNTTSNSESSPVRRISEAVEHSDSGPAVSHYRAGRAS
jgi:hypothetical protein